MSPLRLIFMGSPDFAVPALKALLAAGHDVIAVYSQPPRRAGRGQRERLAPVHGFAVEQGLPVFTPASLKGKAEQAEFAALNSDIAVVAAYGLILPPVILAAPRWGCVNIHASLLPRWRGAAPIHRAILAGDSKTGITIMQMDKGLDTGAILSVRAVPITGDTTAAALHDTLAELGAEMIVEVLSHRVEIMPVPQPSDGITYARKLERREGRLDWCRGAVELERAVRGFNPWPGAWFEMAGERIKVLAGEVVTSDAQMPPGTVLDDQLSVACGDGALRLVRLQRPGRGPMDAAAFLRGYPVPAGTVLNTGGAK